MVPECQFTLYTGRRCHAVALRDKAYCHAHMKSQSRRFCRPEPTPAPEPETQIEQEIEIPVLLDMGTILAVLNDILFALGSNRISTRRANLLLDGLRMTMANLDRAPPLRHSSDRDALHRPAASQSEGRTHLGSPHCRLVP